MFSKTTLLALTAVAAVEAAAPQGFNYGSTVNGVAQTQQDFADQFTAAQALSGAPGTFNAARLYTMIDGANPKNVIPALQAAMDTKTYLLLGMWASGDSFDAELAALNTAITTMPDLAQWVLGLSVGSEDLYRISPTGLKAPNPGAGQEPSVLVNYIKQVRSAIAASSSWSGIKVGHVDTWDSWVNGSNSDVIANVDFLGVDTYPYYQLTDANSIENAKTLFDEAYDNTTSAAGGKPVWITETGWPVSGKTYGQAEVGTANAETYWQDVGCSNFGKVPTFWYTLYDGVDQSQQETPSFSIVKDSTLSEPAFPLSCSNVNNSTSSSSSAVSSGSSTATASGSASSATGSSGSGSANGTHTGSPSQPTTSGTSSSGSGASGSGSTTGSAPSASAPGIATSGASSLSYSLTSMAAIAALAVAFL